MFWLALALAAPSFPLHEEALPAGDTLVVVEDHRAPVLFFRVDFPVGRDSPWGWDHDVSSAWNLQLYDPEGALRSRADRLAVHLDLTQTSDDARIRVSCLREDLDEVLDLVDDLLHNTDFDRAELRRWKQGRRFDRRADKTDPGHQGSLGVRRQLYTRADPRRRRWESEPPLERDRATLAATRDAILAQPGRVVGVSGDVDPELGRRIAERLLPPPVPIEGETQPQYRPERPLEAREDTEIPLRHLTQVYFRWAREGLTWEDPDAAEALIAEHVLAGHAHARLSERLRYEEAATYAVSLQHSMEAVSQPLTIYTYTRAENADRAEAMLREELARFHAEGITAEELADAQTSLAGAQAFHVQGPWSPMGTRMWELRHGFPAGTYDRVMAQTQEVSLEEVNAFIARFYDPEAFTMVKVVPKR